MAAADAQTCSFVAAQDRFADWLATEALPGGAVLIGHRQGILYEHYFGTYTANTVVPIASASKLLSALRIAH